ncbi:unnamed protein product, partial [Ectocarpus sp. 13 AM-2016]
AANSSCRSYCRNCRGRRTPSLPTSVPRLRKTAAILRPATNSLLQRAQMATIVAHAALPKRQADLREFV